MGSNLTDDSILLLGQALAILETYGHWTLISQPPALRSFPFLSGEGSEKSHTFANDVTASKSVYNSYNWPFNSYKQQEIIWGVRA